MKAVILAGGRGTRLNTVTHGAYPKPMAEVLGVPLLEHTVRTLAQNGFNELCFALAYKPELIREHFGNGSRFGVHIEYRTEQQPLGTAGAVRACRDFYGNRDFLVLSGDAACSLELRALWEAHRRHGAAVTMALSAVESPLPYGLAVTDGMGFVRRFIEKPSWERVVTDLVNTGIYVISPRVMALVPEGQPCDFARDLFPRLLERGESIFALTLDGYWRDIGDPGSYYRANLDAWNGVFPLPGVAPEKERVSSEPVQTRYACRAVFDAPHRARLMRLLTEGLMEAGADCMDGLTLPSVPGGLHIAPCRSEDALSIESDDPETVRRFTALAERLRERAENAGKVSESAGT